MGLNHRISPQNIQQLENENYPLKNVMFEILKKTRIAPDTFRFEISAPLAAEKFQAGQFIILRPLATSERIPLTIMQADKKKGTITLIVKAVGFTTWQLAGLNKGDQIADLLGPLGHPSNIAHFGTVVVIGGGVGAAVSFAVAEALKNAGNRIVSILGARNREFMILEDEFREVSDEIFIMTDDGSYGRKGFVSDQLKELYAQGRRFDRLIAAGPIPMMKVISEITRQFSTPTIVSLNPIMVDGIGMCGGCRAIVGGKIVFVCVDGPEFDAHQVDFDSLSRRNSAYQDIEALKAHKCRIDMQLEAKKDNE